MEKKPVFKRISSDKFYRKMQDLHPMTKTDIDNFLFLHKTEIDHFEFAFDAGIRFYKVVLTSGREKIWKTRRI